MYWTKNEKHAQKHAFYKLPIHYCILKRSEKNACTSANNIESIVNKAWNPSLPKWKVLMPVEISNKALKMMHLRENILPFEMDSAVVC